MLGELLVAAKLVLTVVFGQDEIFERVDPVPDALGEGHQAKTNAEHDGAGYARI